MNECLKHTGTFSFNFVSQDEVNKHLKKVNANKSPGDDKIPPEILQITINVLDMYYVLCIMYYVLCNLCNFYTCFRLACWVCLNGFIKSIRHIKRSITNS